MQKIRVLFIAPYEGLKNLAVSLCGGSSRFDLTAEVGDLESGARLVKELRDDKYDVVISRGGTTELIKKVTEIPVIDIALSQYDILHAIKLSQNCSGKIAVVGFPKIIERVEAICTLLNYEMNISTVNSAEQVPDCLAKLKADGYSLIIGDTVTVATAKEMQMNGILITSGSESVLAALAEAEKICGASAHARRESGLYKDMLDAGECITLAFGGDKQLIFFAPSKYSIEPRGMAVIEKWCRTALGEVFKKGSCSLIHKFGGFFWNISASRGNGEFSDIAYFYVRRGMRIVNLEKALTVQSSFLHKPTFNSSFYDSSESTCEIVGYIRRLSGTDMPVIIFGEQGTGKDAAAFEIFRGGAWGDKTLLTIDCVVLEKNQLDYLLHNEKSPLLESGIGIYFKRIDKLNESALCALTQYISDSLLHKRNRVIYSCEKKRAMSVEDMFVSRLLYESGYECLTLRLPSLRERSGDIPSIAGIYLNDLNTALGKQVAGLDQESTRMLMEFQWRANMTQLKNVLRELVLITDGAFISGRDTKKALLKEDVYREEPGSPDFLRGTLEEIELKVIRGVLEEEGMNQSSAAKRLDISRSTMWRKLLGRPTK